MKIDCIVTSCTTTITYSSFIPLFIKSWKLIDNNIDIKIIFVSDSLPDYLIEYSEYIILYKPDKLINPSFVSQYIRLLYPAILNYENSILITDIDMLPLNYEYYFNSIKDIDNSKFVIYRGNVIPGGNQYTMCYNAANNQIWSEIFKIASIDDIDKRLMDVYILCNYGNHKRIIDGSSKFGWERDQIDLFDYINNWSNYPDNVHILNDSKCKYFRLCRTSLGNTCLNDDVKKNCFDKKYSDYHALRPNTEWRQYINEQCVELSLGNSVIGYK